MTDSKMAHLELVQKSDDGNFLRVQLSSSALQAASLPAMPSTSHVVSMVVGDARLCKQVIDELLLRYRIYVQPVNYPTGPVVPRACVLRLRHCTMMQ